MACICFWENTSDNSIIRTFLDHTSFDVNDKFEVLLAGGTIREAIEENLTYDWIESSEQNLWSLLYLTGYLTKAREDIDVNAGLDTRQYALRIPNREIMGIFRKSVRNWFTEKSFMDDR